MAAFEQPGQFITQTAGQDFVLADRYSVVLATKDGVVNTGTGVCAGVLYSMSTKGTGVKVMNSGIAITQIGTGGVAMGDPVKFDAGKVVKGIVGTDTIIGVAQAQASADALGAILLSI